MINDKPKTLVSEVVDLGTTKIHRGQFMIDASGAIQIPNQFILAMAREVLELTNKPA